LQSKAVRWEQRTFEMLDRSALEEIAGDGIKTRLPRPFI